MTNKGPGMRGYNTTISMYRSALPGAAFSKMVLQLYLVSNASLDFPIPL